MKKKCFIFDLDGVIVDTAKYHFQAWSILADELGVKFTDKHNEKLKGVSRAQSLNKILNWGKISMNSEDFQLKMDKKNNIYLELISDIGPGDLLPDVNRVLEFLIQQNQLIALGSASKNARFILDRTKISSIFNCVVDGNDINKAKPNPEVFLKAARLNNCEPLNCFVLEDSVSGIQAANSAGMTSIGIGDSSILHEAKYNFEDFKTLDNHFIFKLINS